jgi:hypothetical protein
MNENVGKNILYKKYHVCFPHRNSSYGVADFRMIVVENYINFEKIAEK